MSFKREGDDGSQLNLLKKRRVAELLAGDIPEDEAILMSSGRYACTVCHYRPVFDTVDMLAIHRGGKKHQHASDRHFAKKRELALLVQKRYHESQLKREPLQGSSKEPGPAPLLQKVEQAKRHVLLKEAPYNPCHSHRNEGPSTKPKGKLFFQGIRQMQLKSMNQKSTNQGMQILTNQGQSTSNSANQGPQHFNAASRVDASLKIAPKQKQNEASISERIKSFSKQTSIPGVSSIEIKPYIPKSKRGKAGTHTNSSQLSSKQGNNACVNTKPNYSKQSVQDNYIHVSSDGEDKLCDSKLRSDFGMPTSAPGERSSCDMYDDGDDQDEFPGHEVATQGVMYISEFQSKDQDSTHNTLFYLETAHGEHIEEKLKARNVDRLKLVSKQQERVVTVKNTSDQQNERLKFENGLKNAKLKLVGERQRVNLKSDSERQSEQVKEYREEAQATQNVRKSYEGESRDSIQKSFHHNTMDRQKNERVVDEKGDTFAPLSREKLSSGGLTIKWKSGPAKSQSRNTEGSVTSHGTQYKDGQKVRTATDGDRKESSQDRSLCPALQLFNDRQKGGLSSQRPNKDNLVMRKEEKRVDRQSGRRGVNKARQKAGQKMSEERRKELQRYLELTSAGWVQDHGGQWVRGQDVEFDSDEEPPTG